MEPNLQTSVTTELRNIELRLVMDSRKKLDITTPDPVTLAE